MNGGFILLGISAVPYAVYLAGIAFGKKQVTVPPLSEYPPISVVISAYNEEKNIEDRFSNLLWCNYPNMEVVFVDDCSTDNTWNLAFKTAIKYKLNYNLLLNTKRLGTSASYNKAIHAAKNEIVVVTDADTLFHKEALHWIITRLLSNTTIGAVTGDLQPYTSKDQTMQLERQYRSFYGKMCDWESAHDSTFNFNGCLVAFKKSAVKNIDEQSGADDANIAFNTIRNGFRAVYEKNAIVCESVPKEFKVQFRQKIRRAAGLLNSIRANDDLLISGRLFSAFFFLRIWMLVVSPFAFFIGILANPVLLILAILSLTVPFCRAFILNQVYLVAGFLTMGKNVTVWESTSSLGAK